MLVNGDVQQGSEATNTGGVLPPFSRKYVSTALVLNFAKSQNPKLLFCTAVYYLRRLLFLVRGTTTLPIAQRRMLVTG